MSDLMIQAQPPLEFIPPAFNEVVLAIAQQAIPYRLRKRAIAQLEADNVEVLVDLYHRFQSGKIRFLIAFRHPRVDDPLCISQLIWRFLPQVARQQGVSLQRPLHTHFIYDRGIPLWAGAKMGWFYSHLGGTPIHRGKADWTGLRSARDLFVNGRFPMAASPEGATNGHNELISPLEPGIAQMSFWCVEDLLKAGRTEEVLIVPVGIQYHYLEAPWKAIDKLLGELEVASGLPMLVGEMTPELRYERLFRLGDRLVTLMEDFYTRFYHQTFAPPVESFDNEALAARLQVLLNTALTVAEQYFHLTPKGSLIDRCRRLEQAGWNVIYRDDVDLKALSPLERGLANRLADEAHRRLWHMRLVESFVAVTGSYVREKLTVERFAETTLLLWDVVTRIRGGNPFQRPKLGKQRVKMTVGQPISVSERYPTFSANRHGARQAVADLTQDLQQGLESLIVVRDP